MIEKAYQPNEVEDRIYRAWEAAHAFDSGRPDRAKAEPYCIVIPPPNVTGSLHMGHALNNTLQDILCRFERMRGKDVLWQVGTDHAGIATQMVVERQLMERQEHRSQLGRDEFVKRVWKWKEESGGTIIRQLKKLGASCDWRRLRFTMGEPNIPNDQMVRAVTKAFVELHEKKLIYKDKRLVNWDPKFQSAISDLEVVQLEKRGSFQWPKGGDVAFDAEALAKVLKRDPNGHLYYFRYPLTKPIPGYEKDHITVATTRPETMLGDTGVAVHPEDERYLPLLKANATVKLPLVEREIPIIADEYSDPAKGTGAVKITPAHDFNDFEVGKRHRLMQLNVLDASGRIEKRSSSSLNPIPEDLQGLDRFEARYRVVEIMQSRGYLEKIEPTTHMVPHGDRSGVVIEPWLTDQWYVDAKTLAKLAIDAVESGKTVFVPKSWEKTYFEWMRNIQPWCISRQLWWGHQIPAWYGPFAGDAPDPTKFYGQTYFVAMNELDALRQAREVYQVEKLGLDIAIGRDLEDTQESIRDIAAGRSKTLKLYRDPDVLDTWFSSALWPFSTLGWPDATSELKRYYPTQVLVTGFDIIFFWVARMMMMGLHFMEKERPAAPSDQWVPFRHVYIHALVRDERGAKMSKSKGNVIDPLSIIDDYGADALRFTLAAMAAQGRDIKLSANRVEGYRNFATKLWNAARFGEVNGCKRVVGFDPKQARATLNRWILGEAAKAAREVTAAIEAYRFNEAAGAAYRFVWSIYCDWYIELAKPVLAGADGPAKDETRATAAFVLDEILKILHPFMPFLTEELWRVTGETGPKRETMLVLANWPELEGLEDKEAEAEIGWLVDFITAIRSIRSEMNIAPSTLISAVLVGASSATQQRALKRSDEIRRLARINGHVGLKDAAPSGSVQLIVRGEVVALPLAGLVDLAAEKARLEKELGKIAADIGHIDKKLDNADFMARAPEDVVDEQREKREEAQGRAAKVREALERLKGAA